MIFLAEMGDKTDSGHGICTQFPMAKVMLGIGIGAFLNHGAAVALGSYLSRLVPINTIQMIAGAAFIGFALWTLKPDDGKGAEEKEARRQLGPVTTVALAFFLGELGDKTQLTAITLAADAAYPLMVLIGTVSGMVATGALGIIVGKKLGERIPEIAVKLAASIFYVPRCRSYPTPSLSSIRTRLSSYLFFLCWLYWCFGWYIPSFNGSGKESNLNWLLLPRCSGITTST